jgi:methionyl-tRNA formyltransferase
MRVLCCLNRDLASSLALNLLLPVLRPHDVLVGLTERVGGAVPRDPQAPPRRELGIAEQSLPNEVLFPLIERAHLPDSGSRLLTFAEVERCRGISIAPLPSPNTPAGLDVVTAFGPDLIVTVRYGAILKDPVIGIPRCGVLNLHSGILPSYRGVLATFRALLNGDAEIGCTLHFISDSTIDTGDIVGIRTVPVNPDHSLLWHILALYPPGVALLSEVIESLANGVRPQRTRQPVTAGAYYSYPTPAEWAEFASRGWRIADARDILDVFMRYTR